MAAYVITDVEITDAGLYKQFVEQVTPIVESHGGKFVARGGKLEIISGDWTPDRIAILEFGSIEQIHTWMNSPEQKKIDAIRFKSANVNMVVVDGL